MPRNIEIKSRIDGTLTELIERIQPFADGPPQELCQSDIFFHCPSGGRLKLRVEQVFISFRFGCLSFQRRIFLIESSSTISLL